MSFKLEIIVTKGAPVEFRVDDQLVEKDQYDTAQKAMDDLKAYGRFGLPSLWEAYRVLGYTFPEQGATWSPPPPVRLDWTYSATAYYQIELTDPA